jgi:hypothetical protein
MLFRVVIERFLGCEQARLIVLSLLLMFWAPRARAFVSYVNDTGQAEKWNLTNSPPVVPTNVLNRATHSVRYFLGLDAFPEPKRTAVLNAARACFDQWQAVPGSTLRFEYCGTMSGNYEVKADNTNMVFWITNATLLIDGQLDSLRGATGTTFSSVLADSTLVEADIALDANRYTWFTDFNDHVNKGYFVEAVLLHEIGHFIGLDHSPLGAATMFPHGGAGVSVQAGLSVDEIAAVRTLYPTNGLSAALAQLTGVVTKSGAPVLGAIVVAEDPAGNVASATLTRANGQYFMTGLPPGTYQIRVSPLDPASTASRYALARGIDISDTFTSADTAFVPTANTMVTLKAGVLSALNFTVANGTPFHINGVSPPLANFPVAVGPGPTNVLVEVYSFDMPSSNAVLRVTGDGLTFSDTTLIPNAFPGVIPPLNLLSVTVQIAANATPGMRSLVVQQAAGLSYANAFLEIAPSFPDYNFDGLDDLFQRQYFPLWTAPEAAPNADPDGDHFTNAAEYIAGSDPTDPRSFLQIESVRLDASGATIAWPSKAGKKYQVLSRPTIDSSRGWQPLGSPLISTGDHTQFTDSRANTLQFYRVQALPLN